MKTIDINLIGELDVSEYSKAVIKKDNLDTGTKILVVVFLVGIFTLFITSFGLWFITENLSKKHRPQLTKLKTEHQKLDKEQKNLSTYRKNLQKELEIAEFKLLAKNQIDGTFIPWSEVLKDLAAKIPKNIVVLSIDKTSAFRSAGQANKLNISGIVPVSSKNKVKPFTAVSFLILNINEDKNSLLQNAKIKRIEYKSEANVYEFEIQTDIQKKSIKE